MKLSLILEAIDRASRPLDRVDRATGGLGRTSRRAADDVRGLDRRMETATRTAGRMERAARGVGSGLAAASRRGVGALAALDRRLSISQARMEKLAFSAGTLIGSTIRGGVIAGGAVAGAGLTAALYKVVAAGLDNEKFRTQLNGLEGSENAGKKAFSWVTDFAKKTPYEMTEVMEAFIALKAYGIDPTNGTLRSLGDTAAGMGKDIMQAVEMLADAQTGEFERIKEFGVKAAVEGDKVTFRWQRNGKEMSKTVKNSATDIRQALLSIMDQRFAGGMDRLARTTAGKWSNLMDTMTQTAARVWETSFGPAVNKQMDRLLGQLDKLEQDGSLRKWADETSEGIADVVTTLAEADWEGFARDARGVASALSEIGAMAGWASGQLSGLRKWMADKELQADRYSGILGSIGFKNGVLGYYPPDWVRGGGASKQGAATAPAIAPYKNRNAAAAAGKMNWPRPNSSGVPFIGAAEPQTRPSARSVSEAQWRRALAAPRTLPSQKAVPAKPQPAPKGEISLRVTADQSLKVRPTKVAATGMDLEVNTGRAMGTIA